MQHLFMVSYFLKMLQHLIMYSSFIASIGLPLLGKGQRYHDEADIQRQLLDFSSRSSSLHVQVDYGNDDESHRRKRRSSRRSNIQKDSNKLCTGRSYGCKRKTWSTTGATDDFWARFNDPLTILQKSDHHSGTEITSTISTEIMKFEISTEKAPLGRSQEITGRHRNQHGHQSSYVISIKELDSLTQLPKTSLTQKLDNLSNVSKEVNSISVMSSDENNITLLSEGSSNFPSAYNENVKTAIIDESLSNNSYSNEEKINSTFELQTLLNLTNQIPETKLTSITLSEEKLETPLALEKIIEKKSEFISEFETSTESWRINYELTKNNLMPRDGLRKITISEIESENLLAENIPSFSTENISFENATDKTTSGQPQERIGRHRKIDGHKNSTEKIIEKKSELISEFETSTESLRINYEFTKNNSLPRDGLRKIKISEKESENLLAENIPSFSTENISFENATDETTSGQPQERIGRHRKIDEHKNSDDYSNNVFVSSTQIPKIYLKLKIQSLSSTMHKAMNRFSSLFSSNNNFTVASERNSTVSSAYNKSANTNSLLETKTTLNSTKHIFETKITFMPLPEEKTEMALENGEPVEKLSEIKSESETGVESLMINNIAKSTSKPEDKFYQILPNTRNENLPTESSPIYPSESISFQIATNNDIIGRSQERTGRLGSQDRHQNSHVDSNNEVYFSTQIPIKLLKQKVDNLSSSVMKEDNKSSALSSEKYSLVTEKKSSFSSDYSENVQTAAVVDKVANKDASNKQSFTKENNFTVLSEGNSKFASVNNIVENNTEKNYELNNRRIPNFFVTESKDENDILNALTYFDKPNSVVMSTESSNEVIQLSEMNIYADVSEMKMDGYRDSISLENIFSNNEGVKVPKIIDSEINVDHTNNFLPKLSYKEYIADVEKTKDNNQNNTILYLDRHVNSELKGIKATTDYMQINVDAILSRGSKFSTTETIDNLNDYMTLDFLSFPQDKDKTKIFNVTKHEDLKSYPVTDFVLIEIVNESNKNEEGYKDIQKENELTENIKIDSFNYIDNDYGLLKQNSEKEISVAHDNQSNIVIKENLKLRDNSENKLNFSPDKEYVKIDRNKHGRSRLNTNSYEDNLPSNRSESEVSVSVLPYTQNYNLESNKTDINNINVNKTLSNTNTIPVNETKFNLGNVPEISNETNFQENFALITDENVLSTVEPRNGMIQSVFTDVTKFDGEKLHSIKYNNAVLFNENFPYKKSNLTHKSSKEIEISSQYAFQGPLNQNSLKNKNIKKIQELNKNNLINGTWYEKENIMLDFYENITSENPILENKQNNSYSSMSKNVNQVELLNKSISNNKSYLQNLGQLSNQNEDNDMNKNLSFILSSIEATTTSSEEKNVVSMLESGSNKTKNHYIQNSLHLQNHVLDSVSISPSNKSLSDKKLNEEIVLDFEENNVQMTTSKYKNLLKLKSFFRTKKIMSHSNLMQIPGKTKIRKLQMGMVIGNTLAGKQKTDNEIISPNEQHFERKFNQQNNKTPININTEYDENLNLSNTQRLDSNIVLLGRRRMHNSDQENQESSRFNPKIFYEFIKKEKTMLPPIQIEDPATQQPYQLKDFTQSSEASQYYSNDNSPVTPAEPFDGKRKFTEGEEYSNEFGYLSFLETQMSNKGLRNNTIENFKTGKNKAVSGNVIKPSKFLDFLSSNMNTTNDLDNENNFLLSADIGRSRSMSSTKNPDFIQFLSNEMDNKNRIDLYDARNNLSYEQNYTNENNASKKVSEGGRKRLNIDENKRKKDDKYTENQSENVLNNESSKTPQLEGRHQGFSFPGITGFLQFLNAIDDSSGYPSHGEYQVHSPPIVPKMEDGDHSSHSSEDGDHSSHSSVSNKTTVSNDESTVESITSNLDVPQTTDRNDSSLIEQIKLEFRDEPISSEFNISLTTDFNDPSLIELMNLEFTSEPISPNLSILQTADIDNKSLIEQINLEFRGEPTNSNLNVSQTTNVYDSSLIKDINLDFRENPDDTYFDEQFIYVDLLENESSISDNYFSFSTSRISTEIPLFISDMILTGLPKRMSQDEINDLHTNNNSVEYLTRTYTDDSYTTTTHQPFNYNDNLKGHEEEGNKITFTVDTFSNEQSSTYTDDSYTTTTHQPFNYNDNLKGHEEEGNKITFTVDTFSNEQSSTSQPLPGILLIEDIFTNENQNTGNENIFTSVPNIDTSDTSLRISSSNPDIHMKNSQMIEKENEPVTQIIFSSNSVNPSLLDEDLNNNTTIPGLFINDDQTAGTENTETMIFQDTESFNNESLNIDDDVINREEPTSQLSYEYTLNDQSTEGFIGLVEIEERIDMMELQMENSQPSHIDKHPLHISNASETVGIIFATVGASIFFIGILFYYFLLFKTFLGGRIF